MEKTEKLYDRTPYETEFSARVLSCEPHNTTAENTGTAGTAEAALYDIILDRTLFFPEEGGQNADTGVMDGHPVLDVRIRDGIIRHTTDTPLSPGRPVTCRIDWDMRFSNMQQHSGEHIMSGLIHSHFGYDNVGFHLSKRNVTLDFNGFLTKEQLEMIEALANDAIYKNLEITAVYPPENELSTLKYRSKTAIDGPVRIVTVPGYDICACCAPHVRRTGEIGIVKVVDAVKYKGGIRISILCGSRALTDYRGKQEQIHEISVLLSSKPDSVSDAAARLKNDNYALQGQILALQEVLLEQKASCIPPDTENICLFEEGMESSLHKKYVNLLMKKCSGICAVFTGNDADGYRYMIASASEDVRRINECLRESFQAKGGGSREMVQGSLTGTEEAIRLSVSIICPASQSVTNSSSSSNAFS